MRAPTAVSALLFLLATAALAQGAVLNRQQRLDRGLLLPEEAQTAQQQQHQAPLLPPEQQGQRSSWWDWLWPWGRSGQPLQTVLVAPVRPDGGVAPPAELLLPASQIAKEGLRPAPNPNAGGGGGGRSSGGGGRSSGGGSDDTDDDGGSDNNHYFRYNSSEITPLVPLWLSWMTDISEMTQRGSGLEVETAWRLSSYVAISYCNASGIADWSCTRCNGISSGFVPEEVVFDEAWDLLGYVGYSQPLDGIVVAFRGTDSHSIYNWVQNMRTWRTDLALNYPGAPQYALVHGGFFQSYNSSSLASNVTAAVRALRQRHPRSPIYVTGHSLGGALATLCALDIRLNLDEPDVRVFTFGSPRVGNYIFAAWFEEKIKVHWRFTHNRDIVPSVPPGYMGFYHISREVWLVDWLFGHTLVGVCDGSGEDMACHNSMCHLGLCSSVSDHLLYLSEMYSPHPQGC